MDEIGCANCKAISICIGKSGRKIEKRLHKHKKSIEYKRVTKDYSKHCLDSHHNIDPSKLFLHHSNKEKMSLLAQLEIKKAINNNKHL